MTVLQGVLAGAGLTAAMLFGVWRMLEALRKENREAHGAITTRIDRVEERIGRVEERVDHVEKGLGARIDLVEEDLGQKIDRVARDVAFLAGRQAERDQQA